MKSGYAAHGLRVTRRLPIFGDVDIIAVRADPARIFWKGATPPQGLTFTGCWMYLGKSDSTTVLYHVMKKREGRREGRTLRVPTSDVAITIDPDASRCAKIQATRK